MAIWDRRPNHTCLIFVIFGFNHPGFLPAGWLILMRFIDSGVNVPQGLGCDNGKVKGVACQPFRSLHWPPAG